MERMKSFVFYLDRPIKLDDFEMVQANLVTQWGQINSGGKIHNVLSIMNRLNGNKIFMNHWMCPVIYAELIEYVGI